VWESIRLKSFMQYPLVQQPANIPQAPDTDLKGKAGLRARTADKIRSELNVEKWPAIWQPAKSRNKPALRIMEREILTDDGNRVVARVEVGYTHLGTLTTEEQKLLYVLFRLWEEAGRNDHQVFFSIRLLSRLLGKKGWGTNVMESITKSLRKLRTVPIEWVNSYYDKRDGATVLIERRPFTFLDELRTVERQVDGVVNSCLGYFKFDDHIRINLQQNYSKPVLIEEFFRLTSEIAQLVYTHIDLMLFDKTRYERKTRELFDDLGLKNMEYTHMYERRRALEKAFRDLSGIRLSTGVLTSATLQKTKDGKDYKAVFCKGARLRAVDAAALVEPTLELPDVIINHYGRVKDPLQLQAEELVRVFHKLFHGVDAKEVSYKEMSHATTLIAQHGYDAAKFVVEFSAELSQESHYRPQTFGGIMHYVSRALGERAARTTPASTQVGLLVNGRQSTSVESPPSPAGDPLASLGVDEYRRLYEEAKAQALQYRFLAERYVPGSPVVEGMIRSLMLKHLNAVPGSKASHPKEGDSAAEFTASDEKAPSVTQLAGDAAEAVQPNPEAVLPVQARDARVPEPAAAIEDMSGDPEPSSAEDRQTGDAIISPPEGDISQDGSIAVPAMKVP